MDDIVVRSSLSESVHIKLSNTVPHVPPCLASRGLNERWNTTVNKRKQKDLNARPLPTRAMMSC